MNGSLISRWCLIAQCLLEWYFKSLNLERVSWNLGCANHALHPALALVMLIMLLPPLEVWVEQRRSVIKASLRHKILAPQSSTGPVQSSKGSGCTYCCLVVLLGSPILNRSPLSKYDCNWKLMLSRTEKLFIYWIFLGGGRGSVQSGLNTDFIVDSSGLALLGGKK